MTYSKEYQAAYYQANKDRIRKANNEWADKNPEKIRQYAEKTRKKRQDNGAARAYQVKWEAKNREYVLWNAAKQRAKRNKIDFNIEKSDVVIPEFCPILGININRDQRGRMQPNSPSLDKINPELGYIKGNVWVISWKANRMKCDATPSELVNFAKNILDIFGEKQNG